VPTDREWAEYLALVKHQGVVGTRQLVVTDRGVPSAAQRRQLTDLLAGRTVPVAVLSDRAFVRATGALCFNSGIRVFPRAGLYEALAWLDVLASRGELIERELGTLRRAVGFDGAAMVEVREGTPFRWAGCGALAIVVVAVVLGSGGLLLMAARGAGW
jgi:hypothetical protein